jgi:hypothetical protein
MALRSSGDPAIAIAPDPEALHREGEVGQPAVKCQRLASEARLARIDGRGVAVVCGHTGVEQTGLPKRAGQAAARGVDIMMVCV